MYSIGYSAMKRTKLKIILDSLRNNKGQVFPFFVLILVIVIIATMAYVNISQVDTHKIDTMNAADAAALAGAAVLAQAAASRPDEWEVETRSPCWMSQ